ADSVHRCISSLGPLGVPTSKESSRSGGPMPGKRKRSRSGSEPNEPIRWVRKTAEEARSGKKPDFARLAAMTDEDIARQIAEDPDVAPEWTEEMFQTPTLRLPPRKELMSIRVDEDVLAWSRAKGQDYQTRMHAVL